MDFLITLVIVLIVAGVVLWIVQSAPFIDAEMKPVIRWVILVAVALYLLSALLGVAPLPPLRLR